VGNGGNGGTGIVYIRYLTAGNPYTVTASGGTSAAVGDYTVWTFTSTGSITFA
jgi:NAD(P)H-hydrate repair Nnr-like enzyme with NAD(P)H-hydrate epimerase domain